VNRCYFCKAELFTKLDALARDRGYAAIAYGENADDMRQARPGRLAAEQFQVIAPLRDAGLTKAEIRELSRGMGLPTADAPAQPCLSSRIPHGTPVTVEALAMIERGEALVRSLGFKIFRVRHLALEHETRARVLIAPEEMGRIEPMNELLVSGLRAVGYDGVEIDPAGYRSPGAWSTRRKTRRPRHRPPHRPLHCRPRRPPQAPRQPQRKPGRISRRQRHRNG